MAIFGKNSFGELIFLVSQRILVDGIFLMSETNFRNPSPSWSIAIGSGS